MLYGLAVVFFDIEFPKGIVADAFHNLGKFSRRLIEFDSVDGEEPLEILERLHPSHLS